MDENEIVEHIRDEDDKNGDNSEIDGEKVFKKNLECGIILMRKKIRSINSYMQTL